MKTLKQFAEQTGYRKVKSPDEQRFVDKHEVQVNQDRAGNKDDVFKATNIKTVERKKDRKGYDAGDDEKVYEEAEELDELSRATVGRYSMKAKSIADNEGGKDRSKGRELAGRKKWGGTMSGVPKARVMASEQAEQIDELSVDTMRSYGDKRSRTAFSGGQKPGESVDASIKRKSRQINSLALSKTKINRARNTGSTVLNKEEAVQIKESAGGRYNDVHNSTKDLLKKINTHLTTHKANAMKSKNYKGEKGPHWGHVEHMKDIHRTLSDIHDRLAQQGEYAMREGVELEEKKLTPAEMKKREEVAKAIKRENPRMPMAKKMAIATATAKKVAEDLDVAISELSPRLQETMKTVFDRLNEENQQKFVAACATEEGLEKMVAFAIENRGE